MLPENTNEAFPKKGLRLNWDEVRAYLSRFVRNRMVRRIRRKLDESDIVQVSLMEAQGNVNQLQNTSPLVVKAWLRQIARNNLIDAHRKFGDAACRSIDRETPDCISNEPIIDHRTGTASDILSRKELDIALVQAVLKLTDDDQLLLDLRHRLGWTFARIAAELDLSETGIRKRWSRIIEGLQKDLSKRAA
jgi:RNA polymerase sigma-70 factor, ECF subfamily